MKLVRGNVGFLLLILFNITLTFPLFIGGFYESHDGVVHLSRTAQYTQAFLDLQIPPRWAGSLNFGFGSPIFILAYPLAGYLTAFLHILGLSLETSYIIFVVLSFSIGPILFYKWARLKFDKTTSFLASIFYTVLPYRFLTTHVRGGIGELIAYSILPAIFFLIDKYSRKQKISYISIGSFLFALLILSHNGISLIFTPIVIFYGLLKGRLSFLYAIKNVGLGLALCAYFWIPAFFETKYTNFLFYFKDWYKDHFPPIWNLVYSPWGFGPDVNKTGGLSPQIGIPAFLILLMAIFVLYRSFVLKEKIKDIKIIIFWIFIFTLGVFISSNLSSSVWRYFDFLKRFQFPWRFITLSSFASAALAAYVFHYFHFAKKPFFILTIAALLLYTVPFVRVKESVSRKDLFYYSYAGSTSFHGESTTIWSEGEPSKKAKKQFELIDGTATIFNESKKTNIHSFSVKAATGIAVLDNTIYFPGWRAFVDNKEIPIQFQDMGHRGIIELHIPKGNHKVSVMFSETKLRWYSNLISIVSAIILTSFLFLEKLKKSILS